MRWIAVLMLGVLPWTARAATLEFATPAFNAYAADSARCTPDLDFPLSDLAQVTLYGVKQGTHLVRLLRSKPETIAGWSDTLSFPDSGYVWTCWITFTDKVGNESCRSNLVGVNLTASVPEAATATWRVYDVTGRLVAVARAMTWPDVERQVKARRPGIYLARAVISGRAVTRRVVVLR